MGNLHSKLTSGSNDTDQEPPWFAFLDNWAVFAEDSTLPEYHQEPKSEISHNSPKGQLSVDVDGENVVGSKAKTSIDAGDFEKCLEEPVDVKTIPESTSLGAENSELRTQTNTKSSPDSIVETRDQPTNTISQLPDNGGNVKDFTAAQSARGDFNSKDEAKATDGTFTSTHETQSNTSGVEYKGEITEIYMGQKHSENTKTNLEPDKCNGNKKYLNFQDLPTESTEVSRGPGIQDGDVTVLVQKGHKVANLSEVNEKQVNKDHQRHSLVDKITGVLKAPAISFHLGYQGKQERGTKDHEKDEEDEEEDDEDEGDDDEDDEDDDEEEDEYDEEEVDVDGGDKDDESEKKEEKDQEMKNERRSRNIGVENYFSILANFVRKAVSQEDAGNKAKADLQGQKDDMEKDIKKSTFGSNESEDRADDEQKRGRVEKVLEHKPNAYIESIHNDPRAKGEGAIPGMDPRDDTTNKVVENRGLLELENKVPIQKMVGKEGKRPQHGDVSLMNLDSGGQSVKKDNGNKSNKREQENGSNFHYDSKETGVNKVMEDKCIRHQNSRDDVSPVKRRDEVEARSKGDKHPASVDNVQIHNIDEKRENPQDKDVSIQCDHAKKTTKDVVKRAWAWKQRTGFESRHPRKDSLHDEKNTRENDDGGVERNQELFELFAGSLLTKKEDMAMISSKYRGYGEGFGDALSIDFGKGKLLFGWSGERIETKDYGLESQEGSHDFFSVGETFYDVKDSKSRVDTDVKDLLYTRYDDAGSEKCEEKEVASPEKQGKKGQNPSCFETGGYWVGEDPTLAIAGLSYKASAITEKSLGSPLPYDYIAKYNLRETEERRKDFKETFYFLGCKQKNEDTDTKQQDQNGNFYLDHGITCKEMSGFNRSSADQQFYGSRDRNRSPGPQCTYFGDSKKHVEKIGLRETSGGDITFGCGDDIYSCSKPSDSNDSNERTTSFKRYYEHTGDMVETLRSPAKKTYHDKLLERENNSHITASKQSQTKYFEKNAPYQRPSKIGQCSYLFDNEVPDTPQEQMLDDDDAPLVPDLCCEGFISYNDFAVIESHCQTGEQEYDGSCVQVTPCEEEEGSSDEDRGFCGADVLTQDESDAEIPSHETCLENESKNTNDNASSDLPVDIKMTNWSSKAQETSHTVRVMPRDIEDCDPTSRIKEILGRLAGHTNDSLSIIGKNVIAVLPRKKGHGVNLNFNPGTETETRIIQEILNLFLMAESPFLCLTMAFMSLLICKQYVILETKIYGVEEAANVTNRMDLASSLTGSLHHQGNKIQPRGELAEGFNEKNSCDKMIDCHLRRHYDHIDTQVVRVAKFKRNGVHFKIPDDD